MFSLRGSPRKYPAKHLPSPVDITAWPRQTPLFGVRLITVMKWLNIILGMVVSTVGFCLIWGSISPFIVLGWAFSVGLFLWLLAESISKVWAWCTLLLGLESFVWPIVLMVQLRGTSDTVPESEMGTILSAVVMGLFASVFWVSFSYGLFNRSRTAGSTSLTERPAPISGAKLTKKKKPV